jgi:hypothetical protein
MTWQDKPTLKYGTNVVEEGAALLDAYNAAPKKQTFGWLTQEQVSASRYLRFGSGHAK